MPYCRKCGFNMEELAEECPSCGEKLCGEDGNLIARCAEPINTQQKDVESSDAAEAEAVCCRARSRLYLIILLASAALIIGIIAVITFLSSPADLDIMYNGEAVNRLSLNLGETDEITLTVDAGLMNKAFEWKSSDNSVVKIVREDGASCTLKLKLEGKAVVTVSCGDISASVKIELTVPRPVKGK